MVTFPTPLREAFLGGRLFTLLLTWYCFISNSTNVRFRGIEFFSKKWKWRDGLSDEIDHLNNKKKINNTTNEKVIIY